MGILRSGNRAHAGQPAPPEGLCLWEVGYYVASSVPALARRYRSSMARRGRAIGRQVPRMCASTSSAAPRSAGRSPSTPTSIAARSSSRWPRRRSGTAHWAERMRQDTGVTDLKTPRLPFRIRVLRRLAGACSAPGGPSRSMLRPEAADADKYRTVAARTAAMAAQEAMHGKVVAAMRRREPERRIAAPEGRHRAGIGGALRAGGLRRERRPGVELLAGHGRRRRHEQQRPIVLLAGVAGLVAGAFSMASGEWISIRSQREAVRERAAHRGAGAARRSPRRRREELELIYRARGVDPAEAKRARRQHHGQADDVALDTLARGSSASTPHARARRGVRGRIVVRRVRGRRVPARRAVLLRRAGLAAVVVSAVLSICWRCSAWVRVSVFTGRHAGRSGLRMAAISALVATATFLVGKLVGVG